MKCIVNGCTNHSSEGAFIGQFCAPCWTMITNGVENQSNAWFMQEIGKLRKALREEKAVDPIVEAVSAKLKYRSLVGQKKYGTNLTREDIDKVGWLIHAQEEAMDLANYLERLIQDELKDRKK